MRSRRGRHQRRSAAIGVAIASWVVALGLVKAGLAWSDAQPSAPWVETYYVALAAACGCTAIGGSVAGVVIWVRSRLA